MQHLKPGKHDTCSHSLPLQMAWQQSCYSTAHCGTPAAGCSRLHEQWREEEKALPWLGQAAECRYEQPQLQAGGHEKCKEPAKTFKEDIAQLLYQTW